MRIQALLASLAVVCCAAGAATAQQCSATITDFAFGTVTLRAGASNQTSGQLVIDCSGLLSNIGVCVELGSGSGGAGPGLSPRYLLRSDGSRLPVELRSGGNGPSNPTWVQEFVTVPAILLKGTVRLPVFADVVASPSSTGAGLHSSTFSGATGARIRYGVSSCAQTGTAVAIPPFQASALVSNSCEVAAATLDFGLIGPAATGGVDAQTSFAVRCTGGTSYSVRLSNGLGVGATGPMDRRLTAPTGLQLRYGLYLDAARTRPWGDTSGTIPAAVVGTGAPQSFTAFGRIFGGQALHAGVYTDSVLITVEY